MLKTIATIAIALGLALGIAPAAIADSGYYGDQPACASASDVTSGGCYVLQPMPSGTDAPYYGDQTCNSASDLGSGSCYVGAATLKARHHRVHLKRRHVR